MHYKNGREAKIGDQVIGLTYNKPGVQVGRVVDIRTSSNPEEVKVCNVTLALAISSYGKVQDQEYSQCDWLLHAEDCYHFCIGVAFSGSDQDLFAKVVNFSNKWNISVRELPPNDRPQTTIDAARQLEGEKK